MKQRMMIGVPLALLCLYLLIYSLLRMTDYLVVEPLLAGGNGCHYSIIYNWRDDSRYSHLRAYLFRIDNPVMREAVGEGGAYVYFRPLISCESALWTYAFPAAPPSLLHHK